MAYNPFEVNPIVYPLKLSCMRRTHNGLKWIQLLDAEDKVQIEVPYYDRTPAMHIESYRIAQAICDSMNHCRIDITKDGKINA